VAFGEAQVMLVRPTVVSLPLSTRNIKPPWPLGDGPNRIFGSHLLLQSFMVLVELFLHS
jgi:hypothetical protein